VSCDHPQEAAALRIDDNPSHAVDGTEMRYTNTGGKGALLLTRFKSYDELKSVLDISYTGGIYDTDSLDQSVSAVRITHRSAGREVTSILEQGVDQGDFNDVRAGTFWDRARIGLISPYAVMHRRELVGVEILARRRYGMFGEGDIAFYDLAETMVYHIVDEDILKLSAGDLSEKGYLNTFNHITAQAFMTTIYSEDLADFISDVHERFHMPELITGVFSEDQIADLEDGPLDNYIDIINNEWGQELGKKLRARYDICRTTHWTPELLANYLNDIQNYYSWAFQIGFKPFRPTDDLVIRYSYKINRVVHDFSELTKDY